MYFQPEDSGIISLLHNLTKTFSVRHYFWFAGGESEETVSIETNSSLTQNYETQNTEEQHDSLLFCCYFGLYIRQLFALFSAQ